MKIDEVKEMVIEYLKDKGSANISELMRYANCGRQTIYDAINELVSEGKVKTQMVRNRRMVLLNRGVPAYLKSLFLLTVVVALVNVFMLYHPSDKLMVVDLHNNSEVLYISAPPIAPIVALSILVGYWLAVLTLKFEDVREALDSVKLPHRFSKILNLANKLFK